MKLFQSYALWMLTFLRSKSPPLGLAREASADKVCFLLANSNHLERSETMQYIGVHV